MSDTRHLTILALTLRVERRIYKTFRAFGMYGYERVFSNQPESEYTANVLSGGLSWEF